MEYNSDEHSIKCPKCGHGMKEITYGGDVVVDRCTHCQGIWFDVGEAEESPLPFGAPPVSSVGPPIQNVAEKMLIVEKVTKLSVSQLKEELKVRGLVVRGNKKELVGKLQEAIKNGVPLVENMTKEKAANLAGESFSPGAYWENLPCTGDFMEETRQEGLGVQGPCKY